MSQDWKAQLADHFDVEASETIVEPAIAVPAPAKVVRRTTLNEGGAIVRMSVPKGARLVESEHVGVPYLQAVHGVKGGRVYAFIYGDNIKKLKPGNGVKIVGRIKVSEKETDGGQITIYVDVDQLPDDTVPTHKFLVHGVDPGHEIADGDFSVNVPDTEGLLEIRKIVQPTESAAQAA